jgi:hypothetical protein
MKRAPKKLPTDVMKGVQIALTRAQMDLLDKLTESGLYGLSNGDTAEQLLAAALRAELQKGFGR